MGLTRACSLALTLVSSALARSNYTYKSSAHTQHTTHKTHNAHTHAQRACVCALATERKKYVSDRTGLISQLSLHHSKLSFHVACSTTTTAFVFSPSSLHSFSLCLSLSLSVSFSLHNNTSLYLLSLISASLSSFFFVSSSLFRV